MAMQLWIGILAVAYVGVQPVALNPQLPPAQGRGDSGSGPKTPVERGAAPCTEAAPCATPRTKTRANKVVPSTAASREFRENHPCPTSGHNWGACPGYVINHITPPCKGGLDVPANLQWQTHTEANRSDQTACR